MTITVVALENTGEARERVNLNDRGLAAVRYFLVEGTRDLVEAVGAVGVPRRGERFSPGSTMLVDTLDAQVFAANAVLVTAGYAAPGRMSGDKTPPPEGSASNFTEISVSSASVGVEFGWNGTADGGASPPNTNDPPDAGPLDGAARQIGQLGVKVTAYYTAAGVIAAIGKAVGLLTQGAINSDTVNFPAIKDTGLSWVVGPGQALYRGFSGPIKRTGVGAGGAEVSWFELVHDLDVREDFLIENYLLDESGNPETGQLVHVQPWDSFAGLW